MKEPMPPTSIDPGVVDKKKKVNKVEKVEKTDKKSKKKKDKEGEAAATSSGVTTAPANDNVKVPVDEIKPEPEEQIREESDIDFNIKFLDRPQSSNEIETKINPKIRPGPNAPPQQQSIEQLTEEELALQREIEMSVSV